LEVAYRALRVDGGESVRRGDGVTDGSREREFQMLRWEVAAYGKFPGAGGRISNPAAFRIDREVSRLGGMRRKRALPTDFGSGVCEGVERARLASARFPDQAD
jgi:hypothetical protein